MVEDDTKREVSPTETWKFSAAIGNIGWKRYSCANTESPEKKIQSFMYRKRRLPRSAFSNEFMIFAVKMQ